MEKNFVVDGTEYTVEPCTAICLYELGDESKRQKALLVSNESNGEKVNFVVFGCEMPKTDEDFRCMCDDFDAWESDWEVLETVRKM